ncbi:CULLIN-2 domain-containing protein [Aphelenchoides besseyi]|nr:CULLIN-2 domain-containing protein [Aphelenchoides besseyi]
MSPRVTRETLIRWSQSFDGSNDDAAALNDMVARDQMKYNGRKETAVMSDRLKEYAQWLASTALNVLKSKNYKNLNKMTIYQYTRDILANAAAFKFYSDLLSEVIRLLCVDQFEEIGPKVNESFDLCELQNILNDHNRMVTDLISNFVIPEASGRQLIAILEEAALKSFKQNVLFGTSLGHEVVRRLQNGPITSEEKIAVMKVLNAVDGGEFCSRHVDQACGSLGLRLRELENDGIATSVIVSEVERWIHTEYRALELFCSNGIQLQRTGIEIAKAVVCQMLAPFLERSDHFGLLMREENLDLDTLRLLYKLFGLVPNGRALLLEMVGTFVEQGPNLPSDTEQAAEMIPTLLKFNQRLQLVVKECFNNDPEFLNCITVEMQRIFWTEPQSIKKLVALFDRLLRQRCTSDDIDGAIGLLRYIRDKEGFEEAYASAMAMRLVNIQPADSIRIQMETEIVDCFLKEHQTIQARKMLQMLKDVNDSRKLVDSFAQSNGSEMTEDGWARMNGFEFAVTVLTHSFWPSIFCESAACPLPEPVGSMVERFQRFYIENHKERKFRLCAGASAGVLKAQFFGLKAAVTTRQRVIEKNEQPIKLVEVNKQVELLANSYQLAILYLFNDRSYLDISELRKLDLPDTVFQRAIAPILHNQIVLCIDENGVLQDEPNFLSDSTHLFVVNDEFQPTKSRINLRRKINSFDVAQAAQPTQQDQDTFKRTVTEAAIVRLLKRSKRLSHSELMEQTVAAVERFCQIDETYFRERVQRLIEAAYLKQETAEDENAEVFYVYLN